VSFLKKEMKSIYIFRGIILHYRRQIQNWFEIREENRHILPIDI